MEWIGWYSVLGGEDSNPMPRPVVNYLKKQITCCADIIEETYQLILNPSV